MDYIGRDECCLVCDVNLAFYVFLNKSGREPGRIFFGNHEDVLRAALNDFFEPGGKRFAVILEEELAVDFDTEILEVPAESLGVSETAHDVRFCAIFDKFFARIKMQYFIYNESYGRISAFTP